MHFEFSTASRVIFGQGALVGVGKIAAEFGKTALIVTGKNPDRADGLLRIFQAQDIRTQVFSVGGEPSIADIQMGIERARAARCDLVVGFGGGSALDSAKSIAAFITNPGDIFNYLEVIGAGKPIISPPLTCIAIPTTAGTGAEVTRNAVLASIEHKVKVSIRGEYLLPRIALVDPELTYNLPADVTASSGMDAITQLVEPFVSTMANPLTDALCREGLHRAARSLEKAYRQGDDPSARVDMCVASLLGGMALANAKLGAVHGFAGVLGGMYFAPHGAICARLLNEVMEANIQALLNRMPESAALIRYTEIARIVTGNPEAVASDVISWMRKLGAAMRIPGLREYGIQPENFKEIIEKAKKASSMKGNPIELQEQELYDILNKSMMAIY